MPYPAKLAELEPDIEYLLDAIPSFVWYKDRQNRIIRCNAAAAASIGATPAELQGRDTRELYPDEASSYYEADLEVIRSGRATRGIVEPLLTASGEKIWVRTDKIPVRDATGTVVGLIVFAVDITDLKRAEQNRIELGQQLQQSQKMEALGRLAGGIAHDLNNYLTPILGLSELPATGSPSPAELAADLRDIHSAAERAASLVAQLLRFARRRVRSPRRIDLGVTLRRLEPIVRRLVPDGIRCTFRIGDVAGVVVADPAELDVVIMNLAANASDAIAGVGEIVVETSARDVRSGSQDGPAAAPTGRYAVLHVADSGAGMDAATVARMFEPFFTTRPPGHGTGLGLSTVDTIVRQNGGHIAVASAPGQGTQIEVYLPLLEGEPDEDEAPADLVRGSQETVLVVEHQPEVRSIVERILTRHGYRVLCATGTREAEQITRDPERRVDLLLCDVVLAGDSGLALARDLLRDRPGLPVLWISGYAADVIEAHGVRGPIDLLNKPFTATALVERVRTALERGAQGDTE